MFNIFKDTIGRDLMKIANHFNGRVDADAVFKDRKALAINRIKNAVLDGEIGGGGVTPEIMAQIENAQWKTEWTKQLFSETVTTEEGEHGNIAELEYSSLITADTITVTFDGTEYVCEKHDVGGNTFVYGEFSESGTDFTDYPFTIVSVAQTPNVVENGIYTETVGTHSISVKCNAETTTEEFKEIAGALYVNVEINGTLVSADTTIDDILFAIRNGRAVMCKRGSIVYQLARYFDGEVEKVVFSSVFESGPNELTYEVVTFGVSGVELSSFGIAINNA